MSDAYVGEIKLLAFVRDLEGWYPCDGRVLPIAGNEPLFSLLGTAFGGNGSSNFALPDLRGRVPVGFGLGGGLAINWVFGSQQGVEGVILSEATMPEHNHKLMVSTAPTTTNIAKNAALSTPADSNEYLYTKSSFGTAVTMAGATIGPSTTGQHQAHNNMMPTVALQYVICAQGNYPSRD